MSKLNLVLNRVQSGARVKIVLNKYGQKKVVLSRAWLPLKRIVELDRHEISLVEVALNARSQRSQ